MQTTIHLDLHAMRNMYSSWLRVKTTTNDLYHLSTYTEPAMMKLPKILDELERLRNEEQERSLGLR